MEFEDDFIWSDVEVAGDAESLFFPSQEKRV
jgi:hypothetical protein